MRQIFYQAMKRMKPTMSAYDQALFWGIIMLLTIGLVMVYSSSIAMAEVDKDTGFKSNYFLIRHAVFVFVGCIAAFIAFNIPTETWRKFAPILFIGGIVLLILVLIPGIGREVNGSRRWLGLFVINLQPSELVKYFVVLYAADYSVRKNGSMNAKMSESFSKVLFPLAIVMTVVGGLLLAQPDMGALIVVTAIAVGILFLAGFSWQLFAGLVVVLGGAFFTLIATSPYRRARVLGFLDPWQDPYGKGYQLSHSLIAFGRGELTGVGLGLSVEKLSYLPEAHTDFLMAIIAEEFGFIGVAVVICLFAFLVFRAFAIGVQANKLERHWQSLAAQGVGIWIGFQAVINIGVNMGVMPTKGLTLPLLSFGGSGIVANLLALGFLMRIDYENRQMIRGYNV
ncbi:MULTISPECIES: putative lipid II flippase FtsW [Deefgea]|uniref:Probable peptidoglycan glycosyltransferase FtsW n=1 Tax=Deefgea chitinilytica TaxID=570276 RepID=A0ABS2CEU2_9NEIS|nr:MULTISPECIES: putative lipid II flippase FtsW [Deefgea]MBM5572185.1 putative lipid II flippase FtsW [Deefgea chitinilytica]MBM9889420.1 putative lipid II flippase FtsW [Deefgea sp. CFH1-16]